MKTIGLTIFLTILSLGLVGTNIWMYYQLQEAKKEKIDVEARTRATVDSMSFQMSSALIALDSFQAQRDTIHFYHRTRIERVIEKFRDTQPQPDVENLIKSIQNLTNE